MIKNPAFIKIDPIDPEYKQILAAAIKGRDAQALNALKGNMDKPIHFVTQRFLWSMMTFDLDQSDVVTIFSAMSRQSQNRFRHSIRHPNEPYIAPRLPIPFNLYDFLL